MSSNQWLFNKCLLSHQPQWFLGTSSTRYVYQNCQPPGLDAPGLPSIRAKRALENNQRIQRYQNNQRIPIKIYRVPMVPSKYLQRYLTKLPIQYPWWNRLTYFNARLKALRSGGLQ